MLRDQISPIKPHNKFSCNQVVFVDAWNNCYFPHRIFMTNVYYISLLSIVGLSPVEGARRSINLFSFEHLLISGKKICHVRVN